MTVTAPAPATVPMILTECVVTGVERLSETFVRVELGSPDLADLGVDGPWLDQRVKLIFPGPSGRVPTLTSDASSWYTDWLALPAEQRGSMRTYTIRAVRGSGVDTRVAIDLVLHLKEGATGPGSLWAARARVGDRVGLVAPRRGFPFGGIEFAPQDAARILLVADETAVPAVASILEDLPADAAGTAYLEVSVAGDVQELSTPPGVRVVWLPREGAPHGERLCRAVLALFGLEPGCDEATVDEVDPDLWETPTHSSSGEPVVAGSEPVGGLYAWVAGESGAVTRLRRTLVRDAGLDRRQVAFMGYWRQGVAMKG